ncbi:hypothetical protein CEUSTIGMA_g398.t1 [Chlamydomonas eustigma]|uniref:Uncharacterized protein n=1 Tax=Chlamydomonas eustigma TaxID=1157962 RepID=A0A250WQ45_9CHLO|nr:hypothetical protein CEUSTIGMA_g398.t1 [Chlamydomonas eustigma]|eukprot:GAX72943.1 hypothetical protein CEUSTIGMA_g398.t1 [Chlamydomonas eustigma]
MRQPGKDGGKSVPRFHREGYANLEHAKEADLKLVLLDCLECLLMKTRHANMTERALADILKKVKIGYERTGKHSLANLIPSSFKSLLSMLTDSGLCSYCQLIEYCQCPCGQVYRCKDQHETSCPNVKCKRPRDTSCNTLLVSPLEGWLKNCFDIPILAEALGSWRDRQSTDGIMRELHKKQRSWQLTLCNMRQNRLRSVELKR